MADPGTLLVAEQVVSTTVETGAVAAYGKLEGFDMQLPTDFDQALPRRPSLSMQPSAVFPRPHSCLARIIP